MFEVVERWVMVYVRKEKMTKSNPKMGITPKILTFSSRFGASPRAPAACGAFAEGAWDKVLKTKGTFYHVLLNTTSHSCYKC
jgi:hypothetical protein